MLVTGANGFLGRYVAREFFGRGWRVVGVDKESMEPQGQTKSMAYYKIDLPDDSFRKIVAEHAPAVCIHCAGGSSVENSIQNPSTDFYAGPLITFGLLEALRHFAPDCRMVFLSSAAVCGNPKRLPVAESQPTAPISPYVEERISQNRYQLATGQLFKERRRPATYASE